MWVQKHLKIDLKNLYIQIKIQNISMEDFKEAIQKFQSQEREKIKQEYKAELDTLTQRVETLTTKLERICHRHSLYTMGVSEAANILTDLADDFKRLEVVHSDSLLDIVEEKEKKSDSPTLRRSLRNKHPPTEDVVNFHSIKDRIKSMKHDPQNFTGQLSSIGKKMAEYYRKSHNDKDPSKRDEKINDKHTSPVCVYSKEDWEYMDYLIKTCLNLE